RVQMDALLEIIDHKRLGHGNAPDLLMLNFKTPDYVSHDFGPRSKQMGSALASLDAQLARLVKHLNDTVGATNYVIAITADHGMPPELPAGSRRIFVEDIADAVDAQLGVKVLGDTACAYFDDGSSQICIDDSVLALKKKKLQDIDGPLRKADLLIRYVFTEKQVADAASR